MALLTKTAIQLTVRHSAKQTKIWDHKGYKSEIRNIFKNSKFIKTIQNGQLEQKCSYLGNNKRQSEIDENLELSKQEVDAYLSNSCRQSETVEILQ